MSIRHPNHLILAGANKRNIIITYRFLRASVQLTVYLTVSIYARVTTVPPRDFALWAKSLRGQQRPSRVNFQSRHESGAFVGKSIFSLRTLACQTNVISYAVTVTKWFY